MARGHSRSPFDSSNTITPRKVRPSSQIHEDSAEACKRSPKAGQWPALGRNIQRELGCPGLTPGSMFDLVIVLDVEGGTAGICLDSCCLPVSSPKTPLHNDVTITAIRTRPASYPFSGRKETCSWSLAWEAMGWRQVVDEPWLSSSPSLKSWNRPECRTLAVKDVFRCYPREIAGAGYRRF